jgi:hypothetical protein
VAAKRRGRYHAAPAMRELMRTNDLVALSYAAHLLDEAGIDHLVLDEHMSVLEGSLGILPRRLVVLEEDFSAASRLLRNAALTDGEP